ncbi:hypothetical protein HU200_054511 [Digitaria exilis]|uniref:Uncharacterized protein n=1 Tax=Digitaria exilis TaxID=1010633 RepID=A0A835AQ50_9POAL|nr:hypothetical protein HU200_054511 [Digitaria exilis]
MDGWPVCEFNEYVQGPLSVWPSDEEVRAYEAGQAPWPCTKLRRLGQRDKERETRELRDKIRKKYDVPLPDDELLFGTILDEYIKEKRCRPPILEAHDTLIKYWRLNRILYPRPLSRDERAEKRRKLLDERHLERQVQDQAREAQLEAMRAFVGDLPCNMTIRKGDLERSSDGFVGMRDAQRDAVRAPLSRPQARPRHLPVAMQVPCQPYARRQVQP